MAAAGMKGFHPRELARRYLKYFLRESRVLGGPFKDIKYASASVGSALTPKLLGTYELELNPIVEQICLLAPKCVIDVGAAEGYYAVGMAVRCEEASIVAFESDPRGRALLAQNAALNNVTSRISIHGHCSNIELSQTLSTNPGALLIMDAEGGEFELLDLGRIPELRHTLVLVELHPQYHPTIVEDISKRFQDSHENELVWQRNRAIKELPFSPAVRVILGRWLILATTEYRPVRMAWLWMIPKVDTKPQSC